MKCAESPRNSSGFGTSQLNRSDPLLQAPLQARPRRPPGQMLPTAQRSAVVQRRPASALSAPRSAPPAAYIEHQSGLREGHRFHDRLRDTQQTAEYSRDAQGSLLSRRSLSQPNESRKALRFQLLPTSKRSPPRSALTPYPASAISSTRPELDPLQLEESLKT